MRLGRDAAMITDTRTSKGIAGLYVCAHGKVEVHLELENLLS